MPPGSRKQVSMDWTEANDEIRSRLKDDSIRVAIDGRWYDLASWAPHHPGGAEILRHFGGKDATDAFHSLHSPEAAARMAKMSSQPVLKHEVVAHVRPSKVAVSFRELRDRLEREGWYQRDLRHEFLYTAIILGLAFAGTWLAYSHAFVAMVLIGLSMQQANYLAHDWVHGRGAVCWWTGNLIGGIVCGYSRIWWSGTHNVHHVFPNHMGIDNDINLDPYLFLWIPKPGKDSHLRRYQHLYFVPMLFLLALNLRRQSFVITWTRRDPIEMAISCVAYSWLVFCMPWYVALGSVALCGFFVGMITTVPHQNEAIVMPNADREYCFFTDQFLGTRGVDTPDLFNEYFWGGLQYQLEHHLFPTIPRYRYPALRPLIRQLAEKHNLDYKISSVLEGWRLTLETMKQCSLPAHERSE